MGFKIDGAVTNCPRVFIIALSYIEVSDELEGPMDHATELGGYRVPHRPGKGCSNRAGATSFEIVWPLGKGEALNSYALCCNSDHTSIHYNVQCKFNTEAFPKVGTVMAIQAIAVTPATHVKSFVHSLSCSKATSKLSYPLGKGLPF